MLRNTIITPIAGIKKAQNFGPGLDSFFTLKIQADENYAA